MAATLQFNLTGGAGNSDPDASLGGVMSTTEISTTALNNIFDDVDPTEAGTGDTEYRFIDVYNSGDETATSVEIYISSNTSSADTELTIGQDATNNPHLSSADLETLANESTAPASPVITFGLYPEGGKLSLDDIAAGSAARICLKRVVSASATNTSEDTCTIAVVYA